MRKERLERWGRESRSMGREIRRMERRDWERNLENGKDKLLGWGGEHERMWERLD
jgi:hypothetical protein